jgi:hypothetical protein
MSVSAKLFQVKKFPKSFPIETEPVSVNPNASFVLKTRVEELGQSEYGHFTKLNVIHDLGENFEGIGYSSEHGRIDDLFHIAREKSFPAFVDQNREWLISAFSAKDVFNQAFKRLNQWAHIDDNELFIKPIKLDLVKMKQAYDQEAEGPQIKGGWFSKIKLLNVNVAYIGGSDVATSDDWDRYETNGLISALRLDFPNEDAEQEPWKILLAKDGAIFSYKYLPEGEFLKTVIPIFDYAKLFIEKPELA